MQNLHLYCLPLQLSIGPAAPNWVARACSPAKEKKMRIIELAATGLGALAAQFLVVATVLI